MCWLWARCEGLTQRQHHVQNIWAAHSLLPNQSGRDHLPQLLHAQKAFIEPFIFPQSSFLYFSFVHVLCGRTGEIVRFETCSTCPTCRSWWQKNSVCWVTTKGAFCAKSHCLTRLSRFCLVPLSTTFTCLVKWQSEHKSSFPVNFISVVKLRV